VNLHAPAILMLALFLVALVFSVERHGKEKSGTESAWITLIALVIQALILWWGGFWK